MKKGWASLESETQLEDALKASWEKPVVLYKHSTRCSLSSLALNRLNAPVAELSDRAAFFFLDLLNFRQVSNAITEKLDVYHASPQLLLIRNGECVYEASHLEIEANEMLEQLAAVA